MDDERIDRLERRVAELERLLQRQSAPASPLPASDYRSAPPPQVTTPPDPVTPPPRPPAPPTSTPIPPTKSGISLRTSEALLKWAGIGLVVLAVAFALGLAIERGWITPELRVFASSVVAAALFIAGQRVRNNRLVFAETLQGAAFVVAYLTALSTLIMDLVSGNVGFAAMVAVTIAALVAASVLDSPPIAVLGILGGFATPLVLSEGIEDAVFLAFYVPLLAVAGWTLYSWTGWRSVGNATAAAAWLLLVVLVADSQAEGVVGVGVAIVVVGLLAWLVPLGRSIRESRRSLAERPSHFMEEALEPYLRNTTDRLTYLAPLVTLALLPFIFDLSRYQWSPFVAGTAVLFGLAAFALFSADFEDRAYVHITMAALLGAVGLTLALNGDILIVSIALQAVALTYISARIDHKPMAWQAHIMFGIALLGVLGRGVDRGFDGSPATVAWLSELAVLGLATWKATVQREFREYFGTAVHLTALAWIFTVLGDPWAIVAIVGLYGAARLATHIGVADFELSIPLNALAILVVTLIAAAGHYTGEIDYELSRVIALSTGFITLAVFAVWLPNRMREAEGAVAYLALLAWIVVAGGSSDAFITGGWVVIGLATLAWGMRVAHVNVQLAGWVTLAVATGKLLLVDLEATDPLVRIGLFFGIGVSFLALAYLLPTRLAPPVDDSKATPDADPTTQPSDSASGS
ncbi:MAG: DUF2339 domain-containing protein [Acidimicrobiia bacterium]|nr:DUF2339 domain-containing protein [Acidimicrobiia bacterium]